MSRFLDAYQKQNISVWGLTAENEPTEGQEIHYSFQVENKHNIPHTFIISTVNSAIQPCHTGSLLPSNLPFIILMHHVLVALSFSFPLYSCPLRTLFLSSLPCQQSPSNFFTHFLNSSFKELKPRAHNLGPYFTCSHRGQRSS